MEVGLDLIRPLPPIEQADALRVSAVRHAEQVYRPWLEGKGPYPDWERIQAKILDQVPGAESTRIMPLLQDLAGEDFVAAYDYLRKKEAA